MRTLIWFTYFWSSLLCLTPRLRRAQRLQAAGETEACDALVVENVRGWFDRLMRLAGVEVEVVGRENIPNYPVVYVANHQGVFDIPLMCNCLDRPWGLAAKIETLKLPIVRDWMRLLGCVFLDRSNARQAISALNEAAEQLKNGRSFTVFPEGHRSKGGRMMEFKGGAFKIALKAGVPVVPVCIDGSWRLMEQQGFRIRPGKVRVTVLPAIETASLSRAEAKELPAQVAAAIAACLPEEYRPLPAAAEPATDEAAVN